MRSRIAVTLALVAVALFGNYSILGLTQRNGWASLFADAIQNENDTLPAVPLSGVGPFDFFLQQLIRFFQPCVSGERPALSLFAAYFAGQVLPMHTAIVLEGLRAGNKKSIISYSTLWAVTYQSIPVGIIMPIYCIAYVWMSTLATPMTSLKPSTRVEDLSIEPTQLRTITGAMSLGYIFPTVLPAMPPWLISARSQTIFLALWQLFPIWVSLCQLALVTLGDALGSSTQILAMSSRSRIKYASRVYRQILVASSVLHFAPILYAVSPHLRVLTSGGPNLDHINIKNVFLPMSVFSPILVGSIAEGCQILLQYDMYCAQAAALIWVVYLAFVNSGRNVTVGIRSFLKLLLRIAVVGPGGAVLWAFWDRDEDALLAEAA